MSRQTEQVLDRIVIGEGETLFKEGDEGSRAYVVQEGRIQIFRQDEDGHEVPLGTIEKGGLFGEMALIDDKPRMANARALTRTTLIVITHSKFHQRLDNCNPFVRGLLSILAGNVRSLAEQKVQDESEAKD